jgi:hypothetical protein
MEIESRGEVLALTETEALLQASETDSLREILQKTIKERDELKEKIRHLVHLNEQFKGIIIALKRPDGHLGMECKLFGCSWMCKKTKELIPDLR